MERDFSIENTSLQLVSIPWQIEACFKIMGIPQVETMELTGNVRVAIREKAWKQKRVLFMTPQVRTML